MVILPLQMRSTSSVALSVSSTQILPDELTFAPREVANIYLFGCIFRVLSNVKNHDREKAL